MATDTAATIESVARYSTSLISRGQLTALAMSSAQRAAALPDVRATIVAGLSDSDHEFWVAAFLPGQTRKDTVDHLHAAIFEALASPGLEKWF